MTNLSDLFPAGAGKQVSFVASGTLSNGQAVGLTSDGKVKAMSAQAGGKNLFRDDNIYTTGIVYDPTNNRVVIAYADTDVSYAGYAVVGTVSGTSITFGSPTYFSIYATYELALNFDPSTDKIIISYRNNGLSDYGYAVVGTVSGTSISFGTPVTFESAAIAQLGSAFDSDTNQVVITYQDNGNSQYGTAIVGKVSGTSISFGTAVAWNGVATDFTSAAYDTNENKIVIAYRASTAGNAIIGTVSGTSISFGSPVVYLAANNNYTSVAFDSSSNKIVIAYAELGTPAGTAIVGTVSGTSISFGTAVAFNSPYETKYISACFDSNANKIIIAYWAGNSIFNALVIEGTVSGTSISFGTSIAINSPAADDNTKFISTAFDSTANKVIVSYQDSGNSDKGTAVTYNASGFPTSNFIGITDAAISDTASGNVTIKGGISTSVTGLTPASDYYVQDDGTISTVSSSVKAGKALSATAINLEYTS